MDACCVESPGCVDSLPLTGSSARLMAAKEELMSLSVWMGLYLCRCVYVSSSLCVCVSPSWVRQCPVVSV